MAKWAREVCVCKKTEKPKREELKSKLVAADRGLRFFMIKQRG